MAFVRAPFLRLSVLTALAILFPGVAHADEEPPPPPAKLGPKNIVFADLGLHVIGLGFQRTVSPHVALSVSANMYVPWTVTDKLGDLRGGVLRLRPYFFITNEAPRGMWVSPFIQGGFVSGERDGTSKMGSTGALGASLGYAFLFADRVHLSLGIGGQMHYGWIPDSSAAPSFYTAGFHADLTLGFAF